MHLHPQSQILKTVLSELPVALLIALLEAGVMRSSFDATTFKNRALISFRSVVGIGVLSIAMQIFIQLAMVVLDK